MKKMTAALMTPAESYGMSDGDGWRDLMISQRAPLWADTQSYQGGGGRSVEGGVPGRHQHWLQDNTGGRGVIPKADTRGVGTKGMEPSSQ